MFSKCLLACLVFFAGCVNGADEAALRAAFEAHHWFDLRDAVSDSSPLFYRLVTAAAFNDIPAAEKLMSALKRSCADTEQLRGAHYATYRLYQRNGFYRRAAAEARQVIEQTTAGWSDMEAMEKLPGTSVASPRQANHQWTRRAIRHGHGRWNVHRDGKRGEASRSDNRTGHSVVQWHQRGGQHAGPLRIRGPAENREYELRNVAFTVLPDSAMDLFGTLPQQQRGAIGIPILLATRHEVARSQYRLRRAGDRHSLGDRETSSGR
jgi:hypothetical protein